MRQSRKLLMTGCFFGALLVIPVWAQTPPKGPEKPLSPLTKEYPRTPPAGTPGELTAPQPRALPVPPQAVSRDPVEIKVTVTYTPASRRTFKKIYNPPRVNEKEQIRDSWRRAFGCDVWYPYYLAKEVEDVICEKVSVRVFKMKGKPKIEKDGFIYVFKRTF